LKLVNIKVEGAAIGDVWDVAARHGGKLDLGNKEGSEDASIIFADKTFAEIYDEDFAFIHNLADIEARFGLADDIADDRVSGEGTDLIEDWGDTFVDLFFVPLSKFVLPEL